MGNYSYTLEYWNRQKLNRKFGALIGIDAQIFTLSVAFAVSPPCLQCSCSLLLEKPGESCVRSTLRRH